MDHPNPKSRFGQGNDVDRARPHFFHRDYWPLVIIRRGVEAFLEAHRDELKGKRVLDFGSGESPYAEMAAARGIEVVSADIDADDPEVLRIDPATGRVALGDGEVDGVLST